MNIYIKIGDLLTACLQTSSRRVPGLVMGREQVASDGERSWSFLVIRDDRFSLSALRLFFS